MKHSLEFKRSAVEKLLTRGSRTIEEISEGAGVSMATIYRWRDELGSVGSMKKSSKPQSRSALEKAKSVTEYNALSADGRGEYLRKNGLHEENILEWEKQLGQAFSSANKGMVERSELIAEQKKIKELERELRRKDKALAEASALLILKKKADLIWGLGEEE